MLIREIYSQQWKEEFQRKLISFAKKSPIVISFIIKTQNEEEGSLITHINSGKKYFFPFDYKVPVKDFIANIKKLLIKHYPRIVEEILDRHEFTKEELAKQLEDKTLNELSKYEMRVVGTRQFRIDRVVLWKSLSLLVLEDSSFEDDELNKIYRYKMNISPVTFLRNYRTNKFKSLEEASEFFFSNSVLVDIL